MEMRREMEMHRRDRAKEMDGHDRDRRDRDRRDREMDFMDERMDHDPHSRAFFECSSKILTNKYASHSALRLFAPACKLV